MRCFFAVLTLILLLPCTAWGYVFFVEDVNPSDENVVTEQFDDPSQLNHLLLERYGENSLIPYASHDGYAIVNEQEGYFDKVEGLGDGHK